MNFFTQVMDEYSRYIHYSKSLFFVGLFLAVSVFTVYAADGTITATAGAGGSISPSGILLVLDGTDQTYTITADPNYHVDDVLVDSVSVGDVTSYDFIAVTTDHSIEASFAIDTNVITATAGSDGSISPAGAVAVNYDTDQSFTITPNSGFGISNVLVDSVSVGAVSTYTFTNVITTHTIEASFVALPTHDIAVSVATGNGTATPSGTSVVTDGNDFTVTFTADALYEVESITVDGGAPEATTTTSYTFTNVTADHTIEVTFALIGGGGGGGGTTWEIFASASANGTISPVGTSTVNDGDNLTYTITPDVGYEISSEIIDGVSLTTLTSYTFTGVNSNHTIAVTFSLIATTSATTTHDIVATAGAGGTITPSGTSTVLEGDDLTYTITPDAGYIIDTEIIDGVSLATLTSYTFTNVAAPHTIAVTFIAQHDIVASSNAGGTIVPAGTTTVSNGSNLTFTITPDAGYDIASMLVDGVSTTASTTYTFTNITAPHTIDVTFAAQHSIVATSGSNGTISALGTSTVLNGNNFTYTITPDAGFEVATLTIDGVTTTASTTYTFTNVTADHTIAVSFVAVHDIVATAGGNGAISPLGTTTVTDGSNQTFTITPDAGFEVATLTIDGVTTTASTTYTFTNVTADHTIAVTFSALYDIVATSGANGSITPLGTTTVSSGTDLTFTITPNAGYAVASVTVDGASMGTTTSYTFTNITADHTINATFVVLHSITATAGSNGTVTNVGTSTVTDGSNFTVTISPNAGYDVATITIDGTTTATSTSYTFTNVTTNHTIDVTFVALHDIIATANAGGTLTPLGTTTVVDGNNLTYTITPNVGYIIASVTVDGTTTATSTSYTFTNVTAPHNINVVFVALHDLVATAGANGSISPVGTSTVTQGTTQTFTITSTPGYGIATLTIDGVSIPIASTYTFVNITAPHTIDVTFAPMMTHTIVASAGANGNISPTGTTTVTEGLNQTFIITPAFGYSVATLTVDGATTTPAQSYTFTNVVGDHTIAATFAILPTHPIQASAGANGNINPSGTSTVVEGTNQTYTITPGVGYGVATLTVDGVTTTPAVSYTFVNVQSTHTISATFYALPTYNIVASAGAGGTISPAGTTAVFEGYNQTYTITPLVGFGITALSIDGSPVAPAASYTFPNVTATHTISATFTALPTHTIAATAGANGTISPVGTTTVFDGYNQTYAITPDYGYAVATLTVDGAPVATSTSYTFTNVTAAHTIAATFSLLPTYTVVPTVTGGNGTVTGTTTVVSGNTQTYTIVPDYGFTIGTLVIDGVTTTPTTTITLNNVTAGHTIDITFVPLPTFNIVPTIPGGNGTITGSTTVFGTYDQTFTITPDVGYTIGTLVIDGVTTTPAASYTFTNVGTNHTIDVTFVPLATHIIVASAGIGGTISPTGSTTVFDTYNQTFTVTPANGYVLATLTVDGVTTTLASTYTFTNVTAAHTISVTFSVISSTGGSGGGGGGGGSSNTQKIKALQIEKLKVEAALAEQIHIESLQKILNDLWLKIAVLTTELEAKKAAEAKVIAALEIQKAEAEQELARLQTLAAEKASSTNSQNNLLTNTATEETKTVHTSSTGEVISYQVQQVKSFVSTFVVGIIRTVAGFFSLF